MKKYSSELLNTEECKLFRKAGESIDRNANFMKCDPVMISNVLISLDTARIAIDALRARIAALEAESRQRTTTYTTPEWRDHLAEQEEAARAEYEPIFPDHDRPMNRCECQHDETAKLGA